MKWLETLLKHIKLDLDGPTLVILAFVFAFFLITCLVIVLAVGIVVLTLHPELLGLSSIGATVLTLRPRQRFG